MKDKIFLFIIGVLVGAVISTGAFYVYTTTLGSNNSNQTNQISGGTPPSMPNGEQPPDSSGQPPEKPNESSNNGQTSSNSNTTENNSN